MIFKGAKTKAVSLGGRKVAKFAKGFYETNNKDEIAILKKAKGVTEVKSTKASS